MSLLLGDLWNGRPQPAKVLDGGEHNAYVPVQRTEPAVAPRVEPLGGPEVRPAMTRVGFTRRRTDAGIPQTLDGRHVTVGQVQPATTDSRHPGEPGAGSRPISTPEVKPWTSQFGE